MDEKRFRQKETLKFIIKKKFGSIKNFAELIGWSYQNVIYHIHQGDIDKIKKLYTQTDPPDIRNEREALLREIRRRYRTLYAFCKKYGLSYHQIRYALLNAYKPEETISALKNILYDNKHCKETENV